jgi:hypothetical protein
MANGSMSWPTFGRCMTNKEVDGSILIDAMRFCTNFHCIITPVGLLLLAPVFISVWKVVADLPIGKTPGEKFCHLWYPG